MSAKRLVSEFFGAYRKVFRLTIVGEIPAPDGWSVAVILNATGEKLKRQPKDDFKRRHFKAMPWLRKGFGFSDKSTVNDRNDRLARLFGRQKVNKA